MTDKPLDMRYGFATIQDMPDKYFTSYTPRVRVKIRDINTGEEKCDLTDDLLSISTNKAYGRCTGTWQLMLPHRLDVNGDRNTYLDTIGPDDVITIEMDIGDGEWYPVMLGLVDRVSLVRQGGPTATKQVKISGSDMGKLLEKHDISWDILEGIRQESIAKNDSQDKETIKTQTRLLSQEIQMGTSASIITRITDVCFYKQISHASKWFMNPECSTDDDWQMYQPQLLNIKGCSMWSAMDRVSHRPYNMLTTDTKDNDVERFVVRLERNPVNDQGLLDDDLINTNNGNLHTIDDTDIINEDLGVSDHERINLLFYAPTLYKQQANITIDIALMTSQFTAYDRDSIKQHGCCIKDIPDTLAESMISVDGSAKFAEKVEKRKDMFWNWYKDNHTYLSGTIVTHLRPDIRAGHGLLVKQGNTDDYMEYLVEQVSHQCQFAPVPSFTTTLHVTRGQMVTITKKEQAKPPEPVKPEPKPEPPAPEPYDCEGTKQKIAAIRAEYRKKLDAINALPLASERASARRQLAAEKPAISSEINRMCDEAVKNGCDEDAFETLRSLPPM